MDERRFVMKAYLQTYSLGRALRDDFEGSLKKLAEMGYAGVEFAGFYGDLSAVTDIKCFCNYVHFLYKILSSAGGRKLTKKRQYALPFYF